MRELPSVSALLEAEELQTLIRELGRSLVTRLIRAELADWRRKLTQGGDAQRPTPRGSLEGWAEAIDARARRLLEPRPRPVINATGIVVHTNLGRSVLSSAAAGRLATTAASYLDLEIDLESGRRGSRSQHLAPLMNLLFPGSDFVVVNNNAAATLLALQALARDRDVVVSRGELVEIGGSFRLPEILEASGARLKEIGTTNRTRRGDYERALSGDSGLILKVHTSNYKVVGFTEEAGVAELASLAAESGVPLLVDWGSGDLVDLGPLGIEDETPVERILAEGADLVSFSGDKLLGGPQSGFVVGRPELVEKLRKHPLARACRLDRLLIAAMHATLSAYCRERAFEEIPTLSMLALGPSAIEARAARLRDRLLERSACAASAMKIETTSSKVGGGSSPLGERESRALVIESPNAEELHARLRTGEPSIVARVRDDRLWLDLRTVFPEQDDALAEALVRGLSR